MSHDYGADNASTDKNHTGRGMVTRFAPSPSGWLHLGHAAAALFPAELADRHGGRFLMRIEDIDSARCRQEFERGIVEDMHWLGLEWERPVWRQSDRLEEYSRQLDRLRELGLVYPCFCTRADIQRELAAMTRAPHGPEGPLYPGSCRELSVGEVRKRLGRGDEHSWRLDVAKAQSWLARKGGRQQELGWVDRRRGWQAAEPGRLGDVILARKDIGTSYHLAVVIDDAAQGVTMVTRGEDLLESTHVHRLLQELLGLPVPEWWHHGLVRDERGQRLAKRSQSATLRDLRARGWTAGDVRVAVAEVLGELS